MFIFAKSRLKWIWVSLTLIISCLTLFNAAAFFSSGPTHNFLVEKGELRFMPLWTTAIYFHIVSSCVCLATGPLLMLPKLIRLRRLHAVLGYAYLNAVLWISVPTGLLISINAKGGWPSSLGFALTGVLWWWATWAGYRAIVRNELVTHICWMVRSYALALSAVAFRVVQQLMAFGPLSDTTNYVISIWVSLLISLWISETCIKRHFANPPKSENVPTWWFTLNRSPVSKVKSLVSSL